MPFKYVLSLEDFKSPEQFKKMVALLKIKSGTSGIEVVGDIHNCTSTRQATTEDFSSDVLDFYEDDIDDLLEEKIIDNNSGGNYLQSNPRKNRSFITPHTSVAASPRCSSHVFKSSFRL